ncbi:MAG: Malate-2H(+)/Na(+)-lactate antiporter [Verrucomicrobiota bacterium]
MSRSRLIVAGSVFFLTFIWLWGPGGAGSAAAIWPSILAVFLAFLVRDIYVALLLGAFSGVLLIHGGNPWAAFRDLLGERLTGALGDSWNLRVLIFTLLMGGFVEVLNVSGGMAALSRLLLRGSRGRRGVGLGVFGFGLLLFIDGLANAMLIGKTLRPAADRAGISRAKLAFIVDATSAPVAGLALVSTWVAYELSVIRQGLEQSGVVIGDGMSPFGLLVSSLGYRFYNWLMLFVVFAVLWLQRDWGAMWRAECEVGASGAVGDVAPRTDSGRGVSPALAWVPLVVLVVGVFVGLFLDGGGLDLGLSWAGLAEAFGRADAAGVFVLVTALASVVALVMPYVVGGGGGVAGGGIQAFMRGMQHMFLPTLILVLAWQLNSVLKELKAADFLVGLMGAGISSGWLPAAVFLLAAVVSFSTGTSWGTMAIVMPLAVPVAVSVGGGPHAQLLVPTIGAVLAGAVFGDHCSPISDTTIVSAFSCECDVMEHVRTQLPYAMLAAVVALLFGYVPAGWGWSGWLLLPAGGAVCWGVVRFVGRPAVSRGERVEGRE